MVTFAQAQERAERWVNGEVPAPQHREVRVREFDLGFVAWAEDREGGPRGDGGRSRLVIARDSGETTLWPGLPVGEVIRRYEEEYGSAADGGHGAAEPPPQRIDLEATSFLLTPPEWLQEAADAIGIPDRRHRGAAPAAATPEARAASAPSGAADAWADVNVNGAAERRTVLVDGGSGAFARPDEAGAAPGRCRRWTRCGGGVRRDAVGRGGHDRRHGSRRPFGGSARDGVRAAARQSRRERRRSAAAHAARGEDRTAARRQSVAAYAGLARGGGAGDRRAGGPGRRRRSGPPAGCPCRRRCRPPRPPLPDLPPPSGPPAADVPPPEGAGVPGPGVPPPPGPPGAGVHAAATMLADGSSLPGNAAGPPPPGAPGIPGAGRGQDPAEIADAATSKAEVPAPGGPAPSGPGASGAPAGGYVPTQMVSQLDAADLDLSAVDGPGDGDASGSGGAALGRPARWRGARGRDDVRRRRGPAEPARGPGRLRR